MTIAVDFDGTVVENRYPAIGRELPFATETLLMLAQEGHRLVLWTCREGQLLDEAVAWCRERGVEFWAVNRDYPEETQQTNPHWTRKLKADLFIDDRQVGGLPDWGVIYEMVTQKSQNQRPTAALGLWTLATEGTQEGKVKSQKGHAGEVGKSKKEENIFKRLLKL